MIRRSYFMRVIKYDMGREFGFTVIYTHTTWSSEPKIAYDTAYREGCRIVKKAGFTPDNVEVISFNRI